MVLDEVAQRAGVVVVAGAAADADVLCGGDLHVRDVVAVPERFEHAVGEAEREHVLHRLLAEVVVDAEHLALLEDRQDLGVQVAGLGERGAERLLDDHSHLGVLRPRQAGTAECLDDHGEELRRGREVEGARHRLAGGLVELLERGSQVGVGCRVVERSGDVTQLVEQAAEHVLVDLGARERPDRLRRGVAVLRARVLAAGDADQVELARQRALVGEVVDRGQQLTTRQIAGRPEDHEVRRRDR